MKGAKWWQELIFVLGQVILLPGLIIPLTFSPCGPGSLQAPYLIAGGATCLILLWPLRIFSRLIVTSVVVFLLAASNSERISASKDHIKIWNHTIQKRVEDAIKATKRE